MPKSLVDGDVFAAIASPVRRALLDRLVGRKETAGRLASSFEMTLSAVSQQLRILRHANLVTAMRSGCTGSTRSPSDGSRRGCCPTIT